MGNFVCLFGFTVYGRQRYNCHSMLKYCSVYRSMNTRNTLSAWTKTAWCTPRSLWLNHAPTPCGRSSVCGCIALSAAGPTHGSSGRSNTSPTASNLSFLSPQSPANSFELHLVSLALLFSSWFILFKFSVSFGLSSFIFSASHYKVQKQCGNWPSCQPWQV